jgi:hypothetical protein
MEWYIKEVVSKISNPTIADFVEKQLRAFKDPAELVFWGNQYGSDRTSKGHSDIIEAMRIFKEGFEAGIWWSDNAPRD